MNFVRAQQENQLLKMLRPTDFNLLEEHLRGLQTDVGKVLYNPGEHVETVYFPCGPTVVSFLVASHDGNFVETMLVGKEGAIGGIVSQGNLPAYSRIVVQFGGRFLAMPISRLDEAKHKSPPLAQMFARYADCMLAQIFQASACNAAHTIEQRTAKWVLAAMDRTGSTNLPLTQERLSAMLGVGRSYISRVIKNLKAENILQVRRGRLIVENPAKLKTKACSCDDMVAEHFNEVFSHMYASESIDGAVT